MTTMTHSNNTESMNNEYTAWQKMAELINKDGEVWMWDADDINREGSFLQSFSTEQDAQEYARLKNEIRTQRGYKAGTFVTGTIDDFCKAAQDAARKKNANEVNAYKDRADALISRQNYEIKALEALLTVCNKFDGKVINKRFHDAVQEATGYYNRFTDYYFELNCYSSEFKHNDEPRIHISADWSHGYNRYTGKPKDIKATDWQWNTGDRLEAAKVPAIIENEINQRKERIETLEATKKQYREYLDKARKAEALLKVLNGYDFEIRNWAKEHDLKRYINISCIWK